MSAMLREIPNKKVRVHPVAEEVADTLAQLSTERLSM